MKRAVFLYSLIFICLAASAAPGQTAARPDAEKASEKPCPFSIIGLWRSEAATQVTQTYFSFSAEGWVRLLTHAPDTLAQDFEAVGEVRYKLDKPAAPRGIEFIATRGNDVFQSGITMLKIAEYGEDSFTTQDHVSGEKTRWVREKTHRYFLTFAARGTSPQDGTAFAMLTVMDGRNTRADALGIRPVQNAEGKATPVFGAIPPEVYERFTEDKEKKSDKDGKVDKDEKVIVRFELTEAEYEATREIYQAWEKRVKTQELPHADPYLNGMEFLSKTADGLNQCGEKIKLQRPTRGERDEIASRHTPSQHPLEFVRMMRKKNLELHVSDGAFPWGWRPIIELPGQ
jgi:hypothetical protein